MFGFNRVILVGNLVRDPELRRAANGDACVEFRFAVDESHRNRAGEVIKRTLFIDVVAWGAQAESCHRFLSQGSRALIEGRLETKEWTNREGQNRSIIRVYATTIQFLEPPREGGRSDFRASNAGDPVPPRETPEGFTSRGDLPF